jgi:hypothetical protein
MDKGDRDTALANGGRDAGHDKIWVAACGSAVGGAAADCKGHRVGFFALAERLNVLGVSERDLGLRTRSRSARMEGRCSGLKLAPASPPPDRLSGFETRKLAAILAADIVGFSRLTDADEDRTLASQPRY